MGNLLFPKQTPKKMNDREKNPNILPQARRDRNLRWHGMLNRRTKDIFPSGEPEIVPILDDLDRCEEDQAVTVVEAPPIANGEAQRNGIKLLSSFC